MKSTKIFSDIVSGTKITKICFDIFLLPNFDYCNNQDWLISIITGRYINMCHISVKWYNLVQPGEMYKTRVKIMIKRSENIVLFYVLNEEIQLKMESERWIYFEFSYWRFDSFTRFDFLPNFYTYLCSTSSYQCFQTKHMLTSSMQLSHSKKGAIAPGKKEEESIL